MEKKASTASNMSDVCMLNTPKDEKGKPKERGQQSIAEPEKHIQMHDGGWVLPHLREEPYPVRTG